MFRFTLPNADVDSLPYGIHDLANSRSLRSNRGRNCMSPSLRIRTLNSLRVCTGVVAFAALLLSGRTFGQTAPTYDSVEIGALDPEAWNGIRSEEHTSELQSLRHL